DNRSIEYQFVTFFCSNPSTSSCPIDKWLSHSYERSIQARLSKNMPESMRRLPASDVPMGRSNLRPSIGLNQNWFVPAPRIGHSAKLATKAVGHQSILHADQSRISEREYPRVSENVAAVPGG
ncbi:unnamed protein product, partial [Amoebophrya sp. A25]